MNSQSRPLGAATLRNIDAYWRAANYLSVGQIYLYDNPLLKKPLTLAHIKPRLLGHWGTTPGLNFIYVHLNRVIARVPALGPRAAYVQQAIRDKLIEHKQYIEKHGEDMPEIRNWRWSLGTMTL